jgi:hypothetical protein
VYNINMGLKTYFNTNKWGGKVCNGFIVCSIGTSTVLYFTLKFVEFAELTGHPLAS